MNKFIWIFGGIIVAVAIAGAVLISSSQDAQESAIETAHQDAAGNATIGANGISSIVTYTDAGFSPASLTIAPGTTVTWSNESSQPLWVVAQRDASTCPLAATATALNECTAITQGGSFSHTFTSAATVSYGNKERPADTGIVTVTSSADTTASSSISAPAGHLNPNVILQ